MSSIESTPRYTGLRFLEDFDEMVWSMMVNYEYKRAIFSVLVSARVHELPPGYKFDQSIEGKILTELSDLSWGEETPEKDIRINGLQDTLVKLVADACLPLMQELLPLAPPPEPSTLDEELYPKTYALQIPLAKLQELGLDTKQPPIPVVQPSQVMLASHVQNFVWKVKVDGEELICKVSLDIFEHAIGDELETYMKIRNAGIQLNVPQLKGIVKSHDGVVGILLSYIPHKHHSLRWLLDGIKDGRIPETEATAGMKRKWPAQITQTLTQLHELGILWRDIKTDNVLIDDNGDAILLDFGGGNTLGWVDVDKYGTMDGEVQGLQQVLKALGEE